MLHTKSAALRASGQQFRSAGAAAARPLLAPRAAPRRPLRATAEFKEPEAAAPTPAPESKHPAKDHKPVSFGRIGHLLEAVSVRLATPSSRVVTAPAALHRPRTRSTRNLLPGLLRPWLIAGASPPSSGWPLGDRSRCSSHLYQPAPTHHCTLPSAPCMTPKTPPAPHTPRPGRRRRPPRPRQGRQVARAPR